jgi:ribosomal protein L7/L12
LAAASALREAIAMPDEKIKRSELLEEAYDQGLTLTIRGVVLLVVSAILLWFFKLIDLFQLTVLAGLGIAGGVVVIGNGVMKMVRARQAHTVTLNCPYCGKPMEFLKEPTDDYVCDHCDRVVYYENGKPAPVRDVKCAVCGTEYRVSTKAQSFTCERCNRTLRLTGDKVEVMGEASDDVMRNYDVLITEVGRNGTEVAMALQSILVCNLPEARRQLQTLPLTVLRNVSERKADAMRRKLRELGAVAVMRPTTAESAERK